MEATQEYGFQFGFFFKDVSMNIHEKEKQTKTGGGQVFQNVNSEYLKSMIMSDLFFTMLFQVTYIFFNESNFLKKFKNLYFENKCNRKENNFS